VTGHRTVRISCVGLLALSLLVVGSASSSAAGDLHISLTGPSTNPVAGGGAFTVSADVSNSSGTDVNSYTADIMLPGGIHFVGSSDGCAPDSGNAQLIVCPRASGIANGGTDDTFAFSASAAPSAAGNSTITPTLGSIDPNTVTGSGDPLPLTVDGQSDLGLADVATPGSSPGVTAGDAVAGGTIDYKLTVDDSVGPSDNQGFTVQDVLPHGATLAAPIPSGCSVTTAGGAVHGDTVQCVNGTGLAFGGSTSYTLHVKVASSESAAAAYADDASIIASTPNDPNGGNDSASDPVNLVTRADLVAGTLMATPGQTLPLFANGTTFTSQNGVTYKFTFMNNGPSYARNVNVTDVLNSGKLIGVDYGYCATASCAPTSFSNYPSDGVLAIGDVADGTQVTVVIHARADAAFRNLSNTPASAPTSATASSDTTDPAPGNETASDSTITIASRPSPVLGVQAIPGNGNAIVTWQTPQFTGGNALVTGTTGVNQAYRITLVPAGGGSPIYVPTSAPQVTCPNDPTASNCYRVSIGTPSLPLSNTTTYTVQVQAQNSVDFSDVPSPVTTVRPSRNAAASIVLATGSTFATCTTATPLPSGQPVCVSFTVPGGGTGGVFGTLGGTEVGIPGGFCGVDANGHPVNCSGTTASLGIGPLTGYDFKNPIKETILWDSSTIPASALKAPACGANKTIITCFPNNVTFYDESSAALALGQPSEPMNAPGHTHFCADPTNKGGAGNVNWARQKPYTDPAGSACIQSMTVLTGQPGRDAQKGDVQVVLLFTSDSDITQGKR
jgi:uncharacterized repeat protein (TIGR01451 family)